jgi:hypothetical protein
VADEHGLLRPRMVGTLGCLVERLVESPAANEGRKWHPRTVQMARKAPQTVQIGQCADLLSGRRRFESCRGHQVLLCWLG